MVITISVNNLKAIKNMERRRAAGCGDGPWSIPEAPNGLKMFSQVDIDPIFIHRVQDKSERLASVLIPWIM